MEGVIEGREVDGIRRLDVLSTGRKHPASIHIALDDPNRIISRVADHIGIESVIPRDIGTVHGENTVQVIVEVAVILYEHPLRRNGFCKMDSPLQEGYDVMVIY